MRQAAVTLGKVLLASYLIVGGAADMTRPFRQAVRFDVGQSSGVYAPIVNLRGTPADLVEGLIDGPYKVGGDALKHAILASHGITPTPTIGHVQETRRGGFLDFAIGAAALAATGEYIRRRVLRP